MSKIYSEKGMGYKIPELFLNGFLKERRRTERYVVGLKKRLGPGILNILKEILTLEVVTLGKDSRVLQLPSQMTQTTAREFDFITFQNAYEENAPFTWEIVQMICGVQQNEAQDIDADQSRDADIDAESSEPESEEENSHEKNGRRKPHGRDKLLMANMAMSIMLNARSRRVNYFQTAVSEFGSQCDARINEILGQLVWSGLRGSQKVLEFTESLRCRNII